MTCDNSQKKLKEAINALKSKASSIQILSRQPEDGNKTESKLLHFLDIKLSCFLTHLSFFIFLLSYHSWSIASLALSIISLVVYRQFLSRDTNAASVDWVKNRQFSSGFFLLEGHARHRFLLETRRRDRKNGCQHFGQKLHAVIYLPVEPTVRKKCGRGRLRHHRSSWLLCCRNRTDNFGTFFFSVMPKLKQRQFLTVRIPRPRIVKVLTRAEWGL